MKIYLDACALNRLMDDQSQPRVRSEADAVQDILRMVGANEIQWISSIVLQFELRKNPNVQARHDALALLSFAGDRVKPGRVVLERARTLEAIGYGAFDALHLACAEKAEVDALLTTDDRFLRQVARGLGKPRVKVRNPVNWLQEMRR
jgi:predicted nucleic acid-binding protein